MPRYNLSCRDLVLSPMLMQAVLDGIAMTAQTSGVRFYCFSIPASDKSVKLAVQRHLQGNGWAAAAELLQGALVSSHCLQMRL